MGQGKRDWDVITGWEKRIKVDHPNASAHPRWSSWTHKERDIVARKHHERYFIGEDHGFRSKKYEQWAKENAPILVGFGRDGKPMPDWAHADFRESGIPEYVKVVWHQPKIDGHGKWAYDPQGPWKDKGEEPAWSARPKEPDHDPNTEMRRFLTQDLKWKNGNLLFPVTDIVYPEGKDELLGMVESKDPTRGGWVTMKVLEAKGADYVETSRDARDLHFVVPLSYNIQKEERASFKLYFRKSRGGAQKPEYISLTKEVPADPEYTGSMHSKFGGVVTYKTMPNGDHVATDGTVISTKESRAKEDVPQWRKFELGRLEEVDNVIVPGPNALPKDIEQYGENVKLTKRHKLEPKKNKGADPNRIMPDDPNYTPVAKALSWAQETHHGIQHQNLWNEVAAALGADNGYTPMTMEKVAEHWERFSRNKRWTMALNAMKSDDNGIDIVAVNRYRKSVGLPPVEKSQSDKLRDALHKVNARDDVVVKEFNPETGTLDEIKKKASELDYYHNGPPIQGNYSVEDWRKMYNVEPEVVMVAEWGKYIIDPQVREPLWKLDGDYPANGSWKYEDGKWINLDKDMEGDRKEPLEKCVPDEMAEAIRQGDWARVAELAALKAT